MRRIGTTVQTLALITFIATLPVVARGQYGDAFSAAGRDARAASAAGRDARVATRESSAASRDTRAASETGLSRRSHTEEKPRTSSAHVPNSENRWVDGYGSTSRSAPRSTHDASGVPVSASREVRQAESAASEAKSTHSLSEGKARAVAEPESTSKIAWKDQSGELRAQKRAESYAGHGNDRHGSHTTLQQQEARLNTGTAPDGKHAPTGRATRFDSDKAQVEAVERARTELAKSNPPTHLADGRPAQKEIIVGGGKDGYGSGLEKSPSGNVPTGQDQNAVVRFKWNDKTGKWDELTAFPTNKNPTR